MVIMTRIQKPFLRKGACWAGSAMSAFEAFKTQGLQLGQKGELSDKLGADEVHRLVNAGVLVEKSDNLAFRHQLLQDFLVADRLAVWGKEAWRPINFDIAT